MDYDDTDQPSEMDVDDTDQPLTINVTPADEIYGTEKDSNDLYKNCSIPRGMVFMANYRDFDNEPSKTRTGSEIDVKNLTSLFEQMGYIVPKQHINMTCNDTKAAIDEFIKKPELHSVDSCIITIMSHGRDGMFYTRDNLSLQINDDVLEKFNSIQCPALKGKPKIFILQCCRSRLQGTGVANDVSEVSNSMVQQDSMPAEEDDASNFRARVIRVPNIADMYIIYSTVEGYVSFRNQKRGSRLIQAICEIFMNNAFYLDLEGLMRKVSQKVRQLCVDKKKMQVCEIVIRGFDRQFYFNPQPLGNMFSIASTTGSVVRIYLDKYAYPHTLRTLLDQPDIRDLPLFILAVAGEYRTGKSFLLSYFLRYLKKQNCLNWMGDENEPLVGFDHKYDDKSVTQGINIWNQPLIVNIQKEDGSVQRILVLLMDSQGIFSSKDEEEATRTFALTTMISSVLVFNLTHQLNESILSHLQLFTAYAREATFEDTNKKPFQKLMLLIRDWEKKNIKPFGSHGGHEYFHEYFKDKQHSLHDTFRDIACYLMPRPGDCVEEDNYNGCHKQLRRDFKDHLKVLIEDLFEPSHLVLNQKEVTGEIITAGDFCNYFENCIQLLTNVDWKQPHNMLKIHKKFNCDLAKKEALKVYKADMDNSFQEKLLLRTEEELNSLDQHVRVKATKIYDVKCSFTHKNDPELYNEERLRLIEGLTEEFANYKQRWDAEREKKKQQELNSQIHAIREAKKVYKANIEKSIQKNESLMTDEQLQRIDEDAKYVAMKKYEDMCSTSDILFYDLYRENEKKLIEDLSEEFSNYKQKLEAEREKKRQLEELEKIKQQQLEAEREYLQKQMEAEREYLQQQYEADRENERQQEQLERLREQHLEAERERKRQQDQLEQLQKQQLEAEREKKEAEREKKRQQKEIEKLKKRIDKQATQAKQTPRRQEEECSIC